MAGGGAPALESLVKQAIEKAAGMKMAIEGGRWILIHESEQHSTYLGATCDDLAKIVHIHGRHVRKVKEGEIKIVHPRTRRVLLLERDVLVKALEENVVVIYFMATRCANEYRLAIDAFVFRNNRWFLVHLHEVRQRPGGGGVSTGLGAST